MVYRPEETYLISFSGGRSSAMLLKLLLNEFDGTLPENFIVTFANTGKEHPGTLDFVHQCEERWDVPIHWLEFAGLHDKLVNKDERMVRYNVVNHETASREGEPWLRTIEALPGYAPRRAARMCTYYMKVSTMWSFMFDMGIEQFTNLVGYRLDEMGRLHRSKMKCGADPTRPQVEAPLVHAGIDKAGVMKFWQDQDFDLDIPEGCGNCDLCFLKGRKQLIRVAYDNPGIIDWWVKADEYAIELGATRPMLPDGGYANLKHQVDENLFEHEDVTSLECFCTD